MNKIYTRVDYAYRDLVEHVLEHGVLKENRTGVDTISDFSYSYKLDLSDSFPLIQSKLINPRAIIAENLWFLSGEENIKMLQDFGFKFWNAWADDEGRVESAYGRFWRHYPMPQINQDVDFEDPVGGKIKMTSTGEAWAMPDYEADVHDDHSNPFVHRHGPGLAFDQIGWLANELRHNPNSRRLILNAWHPANATVSRLPPCHMTAVFNVQANRLNCHLLQRSADIALGVPFNIAGYAFITELLARESGLSVGTFGHTMVDAHIYVNHIDELRNQIDRMRPVSNLSSLGHQVKLVIEPGVSMFDLKMDDIKVEEYYPMGVSNYEVAV